MIFLLCGCYNIALALRINFNKPLPVADTLEEKAGDLKEDVAVEAARGVKASSPEMVERS